MARISVASINEEVMALKGEVTEMKSDIAEIKALLMNKSAKTPTRSGKGVAKLYSVELKDYEPTIKDGFYKWGRKTDTLKSGNYMACRRAYCYAVATKGQAITSEEAFKAKLTVDYSEKGAYNKAKAEFEKKFPYTKKSDR